MASLKESFYSQKINDDQTKAINKLRDAYYSLAKLVDRNVPKSRESSIAMIKLEESSMWAIKAIANEHYITVDIDEIPEGVKMGEPYNDI